MFYTKLYTESETYIGQNSETETQSIRLVENWILNWLNLCNHWLLSTVKVVSTLMKTTVFRMSKLSLISSNIPDMQLQMKNINKNGKYPKNGHPNWRESKQAFSIICKESPVQSAFLQTLHPSSDNLNFTLCVLIALSLRKTGIQT